MSTVKIHFDSDSDSDSGSDVDSHAIIVNKGETEFMKIKESFDQHKLHYILGNKQFFKTKMRTSCFDDDYNPFTIAQKYLDKSVNGSISVEYKQNEGFGRFYAVGSLGLQSMCRELRHTIACDLYDDIDVVNAHPVILEYLCGKHDISCMSLKQYNMDREKFLGQIDLPHGEAKELVLSLINGGTKAYKNLKNKPSFLRKFKKELQEIHREFASLGGESFETHRKSREKAGKASNHKASFMNILLCDFENKILQVIYNFYQRPNDCVLCFDGLMLRKGYHGEVAETLDACQRKVFDTMGIHIVLKIKPMNEGFELPAQIPRYAVNQFDYTDSYDYHDFSSQFKNQVFESKEDMNSKLNGNYQKVIARIISGEGMFIKKLGDSYDVVRKLGHSGFNMYHHDESSDSKKPKKIKVQFQDYLNSAPVMFSSVVCRLNPLRVSDREFNIWSGFQAKKVDLSCLTPAVQEGLDLIKSYIFETWASSDADRYKYIISWIANNVRNLDSISKIALVIISLPGCGKNTLIEFLNYVLKQKNIYNTVGIGSITQKHNKAIQNKRLIVINEMSSTKDEFKSNFDKIKSYITDESISIEPKGIDPYEIDNISNFIMFTNHRDSIIVEENDRRYAIFDMSDCHRNDTQYFDNVRKKCLNQDVADAFYTYLLEIPECELSNLFVIPDTQLRQEMINLSKPTPLKILDAVISGEDPFDGETEVNATLFYSKYQEWCHENGERNVYTSTRFGNVLRGKITKRRSNRCLLYIIPRE